MGKRSNFKRVERDFYPTPREAVIPLVPHLSEGDYWEPCAGDGALVDHIFDLTKGGLFCSYATDIEPRGSGIFKKNALEGLWVQPFPLDYIITNPPWARSILHPMIDHFRNLRPTWLLFDADWMHTKQSTPFMTYCHKIVSVGRVKWIPDSKHTGKDNCCWYLFDKHEAPTVFHGRQDANDRSTPVTHPSNMD